MGKRTTGKFKRRKHDKYLTPFKPVVPLFAHLPGRTKFCEPCAADGGLVGHIESAGHTCMAAMDIKPQDPMVRKLDALEMTKEDLRGADMIITNFPWTRALLHPLIEHCRLLAPTWILLDADWMHTKQEKLANRINCKTTPELMRYCHKIVSVGRVCWMGNGVDGKDNCCWFLFKNTRGRQRFYSRCV